MWNLYFWCLRAKCATLSLIKAPVDKSAGMHLLFTPHVDALRSPLELLWGRFGGNSHYDISEWVFWRPAQLHIAAINVLSFLIGFMCQETPLVKWNYVSTLKSSCGTVSRRQSASLMENVLELHSGGSRAKKNSRGNPSRIRFVRVRAVVCAGCVCKSHIRQSCCTSETGNWTFFFFLVYEQLTGSD